MVERRSLRDWYELLKWRRRIQAWRAADWRSLAGWARDYVRYWTLDVWCDATKLCKLHGDYVASAYDISHRRQVLQLWWLHFRYDVPLRDYYIYALYRPNRWNRASEHISEFWMLQEELINRTSPDEKIICDDKVRFYVHCIQHDISTVPILGIIDSSGARDIDGSPLSDPRQDLFIKPREGYEGQGAMKLTYGNGSYVTGELSFKTWEAARSWLTNELGSNEDFVVQPVINIHCDWRQYTSGAVPTVRLVTHRLPEGDIEPLAAVLRMPVGEVITDNWATGGLAATIEISSGFLQKGIPKYPAQGADSYKQHPDTGHRFFETRLSGWADIIDQAISAHKSLDMLFVGWDITRTPEGVCFIEANKCWDPFTFIHAEGYPLEDTQIGPLYAEYMRYCHANSTHIPQG